MSFATGAEIQHLVEHAESDESLSVLRRLSIEVGRCLIRTVPLLFNAIHWHRVLIRPEIDMIASSFA